MDDAADYIARVSVLSVLCSLPVLGVAILIDTLLSLGPS